MFSSKKVFWLFFLFVFSLSFGAACSGGDDDDAVSIGDGDDDDDDNDDNDDNDDDDDDTTGMVLIPEGNFRMGCDPEKVQCWAEELPRHHVYLPDYFIAVHEVTNAQFAEFLNKNDNNCGGRDCLVTDYSFVRVRETDGVWAADPGFEDHAVCSVTWHGASEYCESKGGRLPTEAEWEKAAKGAAEDYVYPWGNAWVENAANYGSSGDPFDDLDRATTTPVGYYDGSDHDGEYQTADGRSPYGLHDMAGNASEWVNDWYSPDYYSSSPTSDPQGPSEGWEERRVTRGGSWGHHKESLVASRRSARSPTWRCGIQIFGFRCAHD